MIAAGSSAVPSNSSNQQCSLSADSQACVLRGMRQPYAKPAIWAVHSRSCCCFTAAVANTRQTLTSPPPVGTMLCALPVCILLMLPDLSRRVMALEASFLRLCNCCCLQDESDSEEDSSEEESSEEDSSSYESSEEEEDSEEERERRIEEARVS